MLIYEVTLLLVIIRKRLLGIISVILIALVLVITGISQYLNNPASMYTVNIEEEKNYIKWVDFNVPYSAMEKALALDIKAYETENKLNWIELIAYLATKYGGNFKKYKSSDMDKLVKALNEGKQWRI